MSWTIQENQQVCLMMSIDAPSKPTTVSVGTGMDGEGSGLPQRTACEDQRAECAALPAVCEDPGQGRLEGNMEASEGEWAQKRVRVMAAQGDTDGSGTGSREGTTERATRSPSPPTEGSEPGLKGSTPTGLGFGRLAPSVDTVVLDDSQLTEE